MALFALYARYNRRAQELLEMDADEVGVLLTEHVNNVEGPACVRLYIMVQVRLVCLGLSFRARLKGRQCIQV